MNTERNPTGRWSAVATAIVMTSLLLAACGGSNKSTTASSPTPTSTPSSSPVTTISMQAGLNDPKDPTIAVLEYLPQSITVTAGTTVEWRIPGPEPHTVTFMPPGQTPPTPDKAAPLFTPTPAPNGVYAANSLVNSGLVPQGPAPAPPFRLTFPRADTFSYLCLIHPQMTGTVNVVAAGTKADTHQTQNELAGFTVGRRPRPCDPASISSLDDGW